MKKLRNSKKFSIYKKVRRHLTSKYPAAFPRTGRRPPLMIGILNDLKQDGELEVSITACRRFLNIWTSSSAYLSNLKSGNKRVSLRGELVGDVCEAHAKEALGILRERKRRKPLTSGARAN